ncbi:MAG TPA: methylenetetrahydrofolate reductase [Acetobacteraceae bacterium]|nr:methylenetetrahydrofolate reductase [Acetobacteraceae bacterium]
MDAATLTMTQHARAAELIRSCSIELSPRDELVGEPLRQLLPAGTSVFVNHASSATHHDIVAACARLRRAGFEPVPHVAARRLASFTQASDFLQRAAGEAGVARLLLIGGDDSPAGPFRASLDLLATGVVERNGIREIAFAGYPEGHPSIDSQALQAALAAKVSLARQAGLNVSVVTQFGFEAGPILRWISALRGQDIDCAAHVGIAGPASVATLAKFAIRCGIGASLRALARGHTAFARILTEAGPDMLIDDLVARENPIAPIAGLHVFTFGGVRRTAGWIDAAASR